MNPGPPSGEQHRISHADQDAVVTEVGAGLRCYSAGGWDILDGYGEDEMCSAARGAALLPWPNRLEDGRYEFRGHTYQTALTEPERQNAIHGLTRWMNWGAVEKDADQVQMGLHLHPQPGYPFSLELLIDYRLTAGGLTVETRARNTGSGPLPFGAGHHPYLRVTSELIDEAILRVPALLRLEVDQRLNPTGRALPVEGTAYDFLLPRPIGSVKLDSAYAGLINDADGNTRIDLGARDGSRRSVLWMDPAYTHVMIFTGDTVTPANRRRRGLGIEPMTCPPNAFRSGAGVRVLEPGETFAAAWGITI
jgi:aldose 1-epimerase